MGERAVLGIEGRADGKLEEGTGELERETAEVPGKPVGVFVGESV